MPRRNCCANCALTQFELIPTGRFIRKHAGRCLATPIIEVVPACVTLTEHRQSIWPDDGIDCPAYSRKEGS